MKITTKHLVSLLRGKEQKYPFQSLRVKSYFWHPGRGRKIGNRLRVAAHLAGKRLKRKYRVIHDDDKKKPGFMIWRTE